ncbi:sigma-54-dependent Fis family transcriptional regulator [Candidatus Calescamantes bacterium]|nr:sigma-54-dependent Fis family transcriptional regulator [Candidatus Calescamantes bacterium]
MNGRILIGSADEKTVKFLLHSLKNSGFEAKAVKEEKDIKHKLEKEKWDIVILDGELSEDEGMSLLAWIKVHYPEIEVIMVTGQASTPGALEALRRGAYDYLPKPVQWEEIIFNITKIMDHKALLKENIELRRELKKKYAIRNLVGKSPQMLKIFRIIDIVSRNVSNVFITGESGTGKELVAKAIHYSGPFADKPFVAVDCASMPGTLIESQLFGHVKGAFTGAVKDKEGFFQAAEGGTLFLDQITDLDINLQAKLLRVLQEREVTPVGGTRPIPVNVRIIAATNRDPMECIEEGKLREDLFYRLNVVNITLPPLRERKEDIPLLVSHFIDLYSQIYGGRIEISPEVMEIFQSYSWPGNVRELENIIEGFFALGKRGKITREDLPSYLREKGGEEITLLPWEEMEKRMIEEALRRAGGVKTRAAELLGIDRKRLYRKLKKFSLS